GLPVRAVRPWPERGRVVRRPPYSAGPHRQRHDAQQRDAERGPADEGMLVYWRSEQADYLRGRMRFGCESRALAPPPGPGAQVPASWSMLAAPAYDAAVSACATAPMVALGYGKFVRADRVYALVPLEGAERGDGRRTLVYVEGIEQPLIASRSEGAIERDVAVALGRGGRSRDGADVPGQEALF